jgi:hypothetical protein
MAKKKLRRNDYYLDRLRKENSAINDELEAGRIPSVRQALLLAGLKRPPSPLNGLKREWGKASPTERRRFINWLLHEKGLRIKSPPAAPVVPEPITGSDGHLRPEVVDRVRCAMAIRCLKMSDLAKELGFSGNDYRLPSALRRNIRPHADVVREIESWLSKNPLPAHLTKPTS